MPIKSKRRATSAATKLALAIGDFSTALTLLIERPLKELSGLMRHGREKIGRRCRRKRFTLLLLPLTIAVALLSVLAKILLSPFELWAAISKNKKFP